MVVFHAGRYVYDALPAGAWRWGEFGVDAFFVVSGFVMMVATRPEAGWRAFAARRAIRILPMYWLATLLMAALVVFAPQLFTAATFTWPHFLQSLALWPHFNPGLPGEVSPLLVPGWTLSYELYFYALFALCLGLRPGARIAAVTGLLIALGVAAYFLGDPALKAFLQRDLVFEFVFGMLAAWLWLRGRRCEARLVAPIVVAGALAIVLFANPEWRVSIAGGASFVMVWALASLRSVPRWLAALGDASYSIYLLHPFVVGAAWFAWRALGIDGAAGAIGFIALCLVASAVSGWIAWRVLEAPMTRALRRRVA